MPRLPRSVSTLPNFVDLTISVPQEVIDLTSDNENLEIIDLTEPYTPRPETPQTPILVEEQIQETEQYVTPDLQWEPVRMPTPFTRQMTPSPPRLTRLYTEPWPSVTYVPETPPRLMGVRPTNLQSPFLNAAVLFNQEYFANEDARWEFPHRQIGEPMCCRNCGMIVLYRGMDEDYCPECAI